MIGEVARKQEAGANMTSVLTLIMVGVLIGVMIWQRTGARRERMRRWQRERVRSAYALALFNLKRAPTSLPLRERAYAAGRMYLRATHGQTDSPRFDEATLERDIHMALVWLPLSILSGRLDDGEITDEEYAERRAKLLEDG